MFISTPKIYCKDLYCKISAFLTTEVCGDCCTFICPAVPQDHGLDPALQEKSKNSRIVLHNNNNNNNNNININNNNKNNNNNDLFTAYPFKVIPRKKKVVERFS